MREKTDLIIKNGHIVTMDPKRRVFKGSVAIKGNIIAAVDKTSKLEKKYTSEETIDARHMVVFPGLIDTHTHDLQILLRLWPWKKRIRLPKTTSTWLTVLVPFESALTKEEAYLSGLLSCINMIKVGTTCHIDHGGQFNADEVGRAMETTGVRGILGQSTLDMGAPVNMITSTEDAIRENIRLVEKWNGVANGRIRAWFSLRQIMVCSEELWVRFKELAAKYKVGIETHLAEGMYEVDWALDRWGQRPVEHLYETGFLGPEVLIAHMMYLTDREVQMVKEKDVKIAHCPSFNLNRTRVPQMLSQGITVGLGSDGGSRRSLDLFSEMRIASAVHRAWGIPHYDNVVLSENDLLSMATIYGAKAVHWDGEIGSIEVGKKADMILVDLRKTHIQPVEDIQTALVYRVKGSDVDTSIIDGKVVMKHRKITTVDEGKILDEVEEKAPDILTRFELG